MIFLQCQDKGPAAAPCYAENTNLEVVRKDPLDLCINRELEGSTVRMIQEEWDDFLLHEEKVLSEGEASAAPGPDLWLVVPGLREHPQLRLSGLAGTH